MSVYLSHISALQFWSSFETGSPTLALCNQPKRAPSWRACEQLPPTSKATAQEIRKLSEVDRGNLDFPVHLVALDERSRSRCEKAVCHVRRDVFPRGSFVRVANGVHVSSPELCFVQMATELSNAALIRLGFELCGTYGIPTVAEADYRFSVPFTNIGRLERFIDAAKSMPGTRKAKAALRHIVPGSASAMETTLVMLLCLPARMGGYNLPKPQMNHEVNPGRHARFAAEEARYYCDVLWPDIGVALEYDSSEFHGAKTSAEDARRRANLLNRGIVVVSVTKRSVRNLIELDGLARTLEKRLGARRRCDEEVWRMRQHELHGMLLERSSLSARD